MRPAYVARAHGPPNQLGRADRRKQLWQCPERHHETPKEANSDLDKTPRQAPERVQSLTSGIRISLIVYRNCVHNNTLPFSTPSA